MTQQATKQQILEATITAIEKHGIQNLTTRAIADEAGVNNAALHYYYGTKENLIAEALALTLDHMMEDTDEILSRDEDIRKRLLALFEYLIDGILRFPNLIRAHLSGPLMEGERDSPFYRMLDSWLERTGSELRHVLPAGQDDTVHFSLHTAISALLVAGLMPGTMQGPSHLDLQNEDFRSRYVEYLVNTILHGSKE
ncbi:MAG TPA: TetR/AcrR family transcriptional regulator [Anaerolineales bacterium]|jgi:AcrR family transcriptional regulator|nr:TetR/AcrR family transcriptional regulator [Anaerolineales bacterium]